MPGLDQEMHDTPYSMVKSVGGKPPVWSWEQRTWGTGSSTAENGSNSRVKRFNFFRGRLVRIHKKSDKYTLPKGRHSHCEKKRDRYDSASLRDHGGSKRWAIRESI